MGDASDMCVGWVRRRGDIFKRERGGSWWEITCVCERRVSWVRGACSTIGGI